MACRTNRGAISSSKGSCGSSGESSSCGCSANTLQYKPFTKTFYSEKLGWQTRVGSWNYPSWAVRYLPPARQRTKCCKKC